MLKFTHIVYLSMLQKGVQDLFYMYILSELFVKIKKDLVSRHSEKPGLWITQDRLTDKLTGFLEKIELSLNLSSGFCITESVLSNCKAISL